MRTMIAIVLLVVGFFVALGGVGFAISELVGLYSSTIADPLGEAAGGGAADGGGKDVSKRMLIGVGIGACGVVPMMIGSVMLKIGLLRKLRKRRDADAERMARLQ